MVSAYRHPPLANRKHICVLSWQIYQYNTKMCKQLTFSQLYPVTVRQIVFSLCLDRVCLQLYATQTEDPLGDCAHGICTNRAVIYRGRLNRADY